MIIPSELQTKYKSVEKGLVSVRDQARQIISLFCENNFFSYISRIKTVNSVAEKIETGRYKKWDDLDDLVAFSVIVPTLSDEKVVSDFIKQKFSVVEERLRNSTKKSPDVFRFDLTRYIVNLDGATVQPEIKNIKIEIQIRTVFEHAWLTTTHSLNYKTKDISWERMRLSSQIKSTVEQLDGLILSFSEFSAKFNANPDDVVDLKIKVLNEITRWFTEELVPTELKPESFNRFVDNFFDFFLHCKYKRSKFNCVSKLDSDLVTVTRELEAMNGQIPMSLSLMQLVVHLAIKSSLININNGSGNFHLNVTDSLASYYPKMKDNVAFFDYQ